MAEIDPTKPAQGQTAIKGDLRSNLQAAKDGIEAGVSTNANSAITVDAASFGDHQYIRVLCTFAGTAVPTFAGDVAVGRMVELVAHGASTVMSAEPQVSGGATMIKPASASYATTERYESTVYTVDANSDGSTAVWRLVARP